jgi:very-short-patch-repair endonuclease
LQHLKALCDSDLERDWLDFLEENNLRLPDAAQKLLEACHTQVDFYYTEHAAAIFIDGPIHDQPDVAARDAEVTDCLVDKGCSVIRFGYRRDEWLEECNRHSYLFGQLQQD